MRWLKAVKYSHLVLEGESRTFCNQRELPVDWPEVEVPRNPCPVCTSRLNVVWRWQRAEAIMSERVGYSAQLVLYQSDSPGDGG